MAFKEYDHNPIFLNIELSNIIGKSKTHKFLSEVDSYIDWESPERVVTSNYPMGQSEYGNRAYPPLMLLKAILLQKWFSIKSDPELETQINNRMRPLHNLFILPIFKHKSYPEKYCFPKITN